MVKDITPFDPLKWPQGLSSRLCIAAATGLSAHTFIFKQGEWHIQAPYLVAAYISSFPLLLAAERFVFMIGDFFQSSLNAGCTLISFTLALYLSLVVYRIFFHRLKRFPGPRYAAVSKLWHAYHCLGGKNYLFLQELHRKYGDFVRTGEPSISYFSRSTRLTRRFCSGPSEITVFTPDVLMKLNGPGNNNLKSAWYDILLPEFGVATIRDRGFHDQRRKFWTSGFSGKGEKLSYAMNFVTPFEKSYYELTHTCRDVGIPRTNQETPLAARDTYCKSRVEKRDSQFQKSVILVLVRHHGLVRLRSLLRYD